MIAREMGTNTGSRHRGEESRDPKRLVRLRIVIWLLVTACFAFALDESQAFDMAHCVKLSFNCNATAMCIHNTCERKINYAFCAKDQDSKWRCPDIIITTRKRFDSTGMIVIREFTSYAINERLHYNIFRGSLNPGSYSAFSESIATTNRSRDVLLAACKDPRRPSEWLPGAGRGTGVYRGKTYTCFGGALGKEAIYHIERR